MLLNDIFKHIKFSLLSAPCLVTGAFQPILPQLFKEQKHDCNACRCRG